MWDLLLVLLCSVGACCEITTGEEGGPHVQEQDRKWAEHVKPLLLGCRVQRWEKFAQLVCCAVITSYFLAHRVTWWLLIWGWCRDPAVTKMCFSYLVQLPCLPPCVCAREGRYLAPSAQHPQLCCGHLLFLPWAVWRSKLFCAVCHQDCSTVECEREATA